jgi:aldehyde:ferredoxin oxidoreductase
MAEFGYADKILRVDLSSQSITVLSTQDYADRFLGGQGIAEKLYWDEVPPGARAFDAENALIFATGPLCGIPVFGGSRWQVSGKSAAPSPEHFDNCNLGGRWGVDLKFAGYDAILVRGKSEKPVYLFLHDDVAELKDASAVWGKGAIKTREILKSELGESASVVAIGPAGENMVTMATLLADNDASGSGGLGATMGSKKLKAIAVKAARNRAKVARPERLKELARKFRELSPGALTEAGGIALRIMGPRTKKELCWGCAGDCLRRTYQAEDGRKGKFMCQSGIFYKFFQSMAGGTPVEGHELAFHANKLCDDYGVDTLAITLAIIWMFGCHTAGILSDESTGIPLSKLGGPEFIEMLVRKLSLREGFGDILAQGLPKAADLVGSGARDYVVNYISKAGQPSINDPRLYCTTALLYAMQPEPPMAQLHEISSHILRWLDWRKGAKNAYLSNDAMRAMAKRFWGSEVAAEMGSFQGKALAAKMIQDREVAKECLILCDFVWPIMETPNTEDHVGDPTLQSQILSAVTGKDIDEEGLNRIGERVFNLERAILVREGHRGREDDRLPDAWHTMPLEGDFTNPECIVPGKGDEAVPRIGSMVNREEFERAKDEYYQIRQWDVATGLQIRSKLEELGLKDVAQDLFRSSAKREHVGGKG